MGNMSYCRFENTSHDLNDCVEALNTCLEDNIGYAEFRSKLISDYERNAVERLVDLCEAFLSNYATLKDNDHA